MGGEWIEWKGGVCPVGLADRVFLRFAHGGETDASYPACMFRWDRDSVASKHDIVAYRLVPIQ